MYSKRGKKKTTARIKREKRNLGPIAPRREGQDPGVCQCGRKRGPPKKRSFCGTSSQQKSEQSYVSKDKRQKKAQHLPENTREKHPGYRPQKKTIEKRTKGTRCLHLKRKKKKI